MSKKVKGYATLVLVIVTILAMGGAEMNPAAALSIWVRLGLLVATLIMTVVYLQDEGAKVISDYDFTHRDWKQYDPDKTYL